VNTWLPIEVTEAGMVTDVNSSQPANAYSPIEVSVDGRTMLLIYSLSFMMFISLPVGDACPVTVSPVAVQ